MKKTPRAFWIGIGFCVLLLLYFLLFVPTFDLDESLYRRVAEEMKLRSEWFNPTWDSRPLLHKPPFFYWMIQVFSQLIDGAQTMVSSTAARMPGFGVAIVISLALGWLRAQYLWMAIFPLVTVCAVIFDPIQTLALLPAILIPYGWFRDEREASGRELFLVGLSLFAACAIKGLNGIIVPAIAIGLQLVLQHSGNTSGTLRSLRRFAIRSLMPAAILSAIYYFWLDQNIGSAFTHEFFWVQHFGRSQEPMESHSGNVLYYPFVVALGCGALLPFLFSAIGSLRTRVAGTGSKGYAREAYPLTFALCFIVLFSFSATKLPHYLWPVWPALAIFVADQDRKPLGRGPLFLSFVPMLILTVAALFLSLSPVSLVRELMHSPIVDAVLPAGYAFPLAARAGLAAAAALGAVMLVLRARFFARPELTFVASSLFTLLFAASLTPILVERLHDPIQGIAEEVKAIHPPITTCMWYSGPHSPSLSLALGHGVFHNRCEPPDMTFLIAPDWKVGECAQRGMAVVAKRDYLNLCEKQTPTGVGVMSGKAPMPMPVVATSATAGTEGAPNVATPPAVANMESLVLNAPHASAPDALATQVLISPDAATKPEQVEVESEDDLVLIPGPGDQATAVALAGPDKKVGTADDIPLSAAIQVSKSTVRKHKPKITHIGLGTANEAIVLNFDDKFTVTRPVKPARSKSGKSNASPVAVVTYPGADGKIGTEDDVMVTQLVGPDKIPGTMDDVVLTRLTGPNPQPVTAEEIAAQISDAATAVEGPNATKPSAQKVRKVRKGGYKVTHIGLDKDGEVTVLNFAGPDGKLGTKDDVYVARFTPRAKTTAGASGEANNGQPTLSMQDEATRALEDFRLIQQSGNDKIPGTLDDLAILMFAGPDGILGTLDDIPAMPNKPQPGPDGVVGTADDFVVSQLAGPDGIIGTRDDLIVTRQAGPDGIIGTRDDIVTQRPVVQDESEPPTILANDADENAPAGGSATAPVGGTSATPKEKPAAKEKTTDKPVAALFPKPAASRTARAEIKKVTSTVTAESPAQVKKVQFERNANVVEWQVQKMDYCEAYLCDDRYQSERVIENIETMMEQFPDPQFRAKQIEMLNTALVKAIEYRKNWRKYTPEYEIGLMSQEQVNNAIDPLIARLRAAIARANKKKK